ncbi:MAG: dihydroxyacetone kinase subunit DhaL [Actinomycetaceae bacterium]|nr:dihydroxyacetone kinase subunit DhaL [Actinomycetaceae bacterium]
MSLDISWATEWIRRSAAVIASNRDYLIDLDRQIGDGDHGENLDRGFSQVIATLEATPPETVADALKLVAKTLMSTVGGAAGPLYGTAFLRASKGIGAATEVDGAGVVALLAGAVDGIQARGKAEEGEKTMVDAWAPALRAAREAADSGADVATVLEAAASAAEAGAQATKPLQATKGRASYLGERSIGHLDPGAVSSALLLREAAAAAAGQG